jgi:hypothetical protein
MSLKEICINNIVTMVKNLPPLLKEDVIGKSKKEIESNERIKVIEEIKYYLPYIIENMVSERINEIEGIKKKRNVYPHMSQDIVNICEDTTDNVIRLIENKVMNNSINNSRYPNMDDSESDDF